jgi:tyrosine-protein phosphatase SIW14
MQPKKNMTIRYLPLLILALVLTAAAAYGKTGNNSFPNIHIKNFGQMNDRFYRGARPQGSDFNDLKTLGINTVIDLRNDADGSERQSVEGLGMHYVNIPMSDSEYPKAAQIDTFLKLVDNPATGKFFVHCEGGRHRTGVMGAVYRFTHDGWNYDQAYAEMKSYDFYTRWGHGAMKQYVQDYWQQLQTQAANPKPSAASTASAAAGAKQ